MERYCLTGQSPQQAVAPTEEEEEVTKRFLEATINGNEVK
jgi:hypothetical protein